MLFQEGLDAIRVQRGRGVPIIKPRVPEEIIRMVKLAEEAEVPAVGIDIDAAGFRHMNRKGQPVGPKTVAQLQAITGRTSLPVILKGIMTARDAVAAVEAGAAGIVVSNHGGRAPGSYTGDN
jgi:4-hydroxymandelate oxidase